MEGTPSTDRLSMMVVDALGSVETDANPEAVLPEELSEGLVDQGAVRLDAVGDDDAVAVVSSLKFNRLFEKAQSRQQWLTAMPEEFALGSVDFQQILDQFLEHLLRHHAPRPDTLVHVPVKAVVALQVARYVGALDDGVNPHRCPPFGGSL